MQITQHIVQSPEWAEFKTAYGTKAVRCGEIIYSIHKIPLSQYFVAYCPKVNPTQIDWIKLDHSLRTHKCGHITFDVPNVLLGSEEQRAATQLMVENKCTIAAKSTFAPNTVLIDITKSEEKLLECMHPKHRYNIRLATRRGVVVERAKTQADFEIFWNLLEATSIREKYYIHPKHYYQKMWEILSPKGMCYILTGKYNGEALSSWMLFSHNNVFYYPYGASSDKLQNLCSGNLVGWEAIKLGKELGCHTFDMWGAAGDPTDHTNPWWGFTNFKIKFGGKLVGFMNSYDFVVNDKIYKMFNLANNLRWRILKLIR